MEEPFASTAETVAWHQRQPLFEKGTGHCRRGGPHPAEVGGDEMSGSVQKSDIKERHWCAPFFRPLQPYLERLMYA